MPLTTIVGLVHLCAALVAASGAAGVVLAQRRTGRTVVGSGWLLVALCSGAVWAGHLAWWHIAGPSSAQVLWLPSVGATMGALLAWSLAVLRPGRAAPLRSVALLLLDPVLLLAAYAVLGGDSVAVRHVGRIDYGWFYTVHVLVTFTMMLATASLWAGSRSDPSRTLRLLARFVVGGLVATGVAQALQLMVLDLVVCVLGAVVAVVVLRAEPEALVPRPRPGVLLDGLGAFVLVFDRDDRLVDLNAPARSYFAGRDAAVPEVGTRSIDLLPIRVDDALAGVEVRLGGPAGDDDFTCFAARLGPATSPPHGSVVVLRRAAAARSAVTDAELGHLGRRLEQLGAAVGDVEPVVVLGLGFTCAPDAERAAQAIEFVVGSLDLAVVELVGESGLVAVVPTRVETYLLDVADGWQPRAGEAPGDEGSVRTVSLSPVLDRDRILRHGPAAGAAAMVETVVRDLGLRG